MIQLDGIGASIEERFSRFEPGDEFIGIDVTDGFKFLAKDLAGSFQEEHVGFAVG